MVCRGFSEACSNRFRDVTDEFVASKTLTRLERQSLGNRRELTSRPDPICAEAPPEDSPSG